MRIKSFLPCIFFLNTSFASEEECFQSTVLSPSPFMGNKGEIFELSNGSFWRVKNAYEYFYEYYPQVMVCPTEGYLILKDKKVEITSGK